MADREILTLANASPALNQQFRDAMERICDAFQDEEGDLERGVRKATISVELVFEHQLETRATSVATSLKLKLPGYRQARQAVVLPRGGTEMKVDIDDENPALPFVHALREAGVTSVTITSGRNRGGEDE